MVNHQILSESEAELGGVRRDEIGWDKLQQDGPRAHGPYKMVRDIKVAPIKNGRIYIYISMSNWGYFTPISGVITILDLPTPKNIGVLGF